MAMTTLCPQCKSVCTIPDAAVGRQVVCSRCETVFPGDPYVPPKKLRTKPSFHKRMGALVLFLILLGVAGTVSIVVASIVFAFYQFQLAMHPSTAFTMTPDARGGIGFGAMPMVLDPDLEDKNALAQKHIPPSMALLQAPPAFVIPAALAQPVDLNRHPRVGEFGVTLQTWLQARESLPDGSSADLKSRTLAELSETVQAVDASEQASVRLRYRGYLADASRDGVSQTMRLAASSDLSWATAFFLLSDKGEPTAHRLDVSRVPAGAEEAVRKVHETERSLFEFFALPLPNETAAKPGAAWTFQRVVPLQFSDEAETTRLLDVTASLRGFHHAGSGNYAVVELRGKLTRAGTGQGEAAAAREARGWALVDSATGIVMQGQAEVPFAIILSPEKTPRHISGTLYLSLQRRTPPVVEENN